MLVLKQGFYRFQVANQPIDSVGPEGHRKGTSRMLLMVEKQILNPIAKPLKERADAVVIPFFHPSTPSLAARSRSRFLVSS